MPTVMAKCVVALGSGTIELQIPDRLRQQVVLAATRLRDSDVSARLSLHGACLAMCRGMMRRG
jgi:hypothetical protein